jgi:hypothetical protein
MVFGRFLLSRRARHQFSCGFCDLSGVVAYPFIVSFFRFGCCRQRISRIFFFQKNAAKFSSESGQCNLVTVISSLLQFCLPPGVFMSIWNLLSRDYLLIWAVCDPREAYLLCSDILCVRSSDNVLSFFFYLIGYTQVNSLLN